MPKGFSIDVSAMYQSKVLYSIASINGFADVSAGVKKSFVDGKATFKLAFSDIFNTNNIQGKIVYSNLDSYFTQNNDRRRISLDFSYRFGKTAGGQRQRQNAIEDEERRVKKGGS